MRKTIKPRIAIAEMTKHNGSGYADKPTRAFPDIELPNPKGGDRPPLHVRQVEFMSIGMFPLADNKGDLTPIGVILADAETGEGMMFTLSGEEAMQQGLTLQQIANKDQRARIFETSTEAEDWPR